MNHTLLRYLFICAALVFSSRTLLAQIGTPYCQGSSCPCGNDDHTAGCGNHGLDGDPATGARLEVGSGSADVFLDDLELVVSGVQPGQRGLIFMGGAALDLPFGDGRRCVGSGGVGVYRFPVRVANAGGTYREVAPVHTSRVFDGGAIVAGVTWYFQGWYRDPAGPCGTSFNSTNGLPVTFTPPGTGGPIETQLAGNPLRAYPRFEFVRSFHQGSTVQLALDPALFPFTIGATADVYVVAAKTKSEWDGDPTLVDVSGAPRTTLFPGTDLPSNTIVVDSGALNGTVGAKVGVGYDLILDFDQDGVLGAGDFIDGYSKQAGFYVVRDTSLPGPYTVVETLNNGGTWLTQDIYHPSNIASLGEVPLVMISHGNGHDYRWYDHLGYHLASYGYVVASHRNNTMPGIGTASTTTLTNTDYVLGNLGTIVGGVLAGHIDVHRIIWIGHSRGGEGIVRAYDRIVDGTYTPQHYVVDDIRLLSSIAPTDFLGSASANPHGVDYHLWVGTADADVTGGPNNDIAQSYHLLERATNRRLSISLYGAGHGAFHDGGGSLVATGPCTINRLVCHPIMQGYLLPMIRYTVGGDPPSKDFLWRQYERFHPPAVAIDDPCVVVNLEYKDGGESGNFVIDDYQSEPSVDTSSSGGSVSMTVSNVHEGKLNDNNNTFTWVASDPMNGMTRARNSDFTNGLVFDWNSPSYYELEITPSHRDLRQRGYLSFRATQCCRHPNTTASLEDLSFSVVLRDGTGRVSSISIGTYRGGIEEPYQRMGDGAGAGWGNEFETIRIRLRDFQAEGRALDLSDVVAVRFKFGYHDESPEGRLGLDDIQITRN
jgi:hypothetical protein